ncbi:MFS transporter [Candidatus Bathyarchaeota archaeon]|nr:MFS transporter [Candidatus Bathyarchaeota archaeon]
MGEQGEEKRSVMADVFSIYIPSFFNTIGMSIVSPILPVYARSFGVSFAVASLAITVNAFGRFIADVPVGIAADKWGRRNMMLIGSFIVMLMAVANANAPNFTFFLIFRFFQGIGSSMWMTSRQTLLADILRPEERGRIMGYFQTFILLGQSAGPSFGGWIADAYGLTAPFYFYAFTNFLTLIISYFLIHDVKGVIKKTSQGGGHGFTFKDAIRLLKNRTYAMACLATLTVTFARSGIRGNILPIYAVDELGMSATDIGTIISFATLSNLILTVPMGYAIDLIGRKPVIIWNIIILALANLSFVFAKDYWTMSLAAVVLGIASAGAGQAPSSLAVDATYNERRGLAMGFYRLVSDVGSMIGPVILSTIADSTNLHMPFYAMAGILLVNSLLHALLTKELIDVKKNREEQMKQGIKIGPFKFGGVKET